MKVFLAVLALGTAQLSGPQLARDLLAALRSAPADLTGPVTFGLEEVRSVRCQMSEEKPAEYRCRFKAEDRSGRWRGHSATVAVDGRRWVLLSLD